MIDYQHKQLVKNKLSLVRWVLQLTGFIALGLGILGIFLPLLPTVPLILLALACFARSSDKFYLWLLNHPRFGPIISPYLKGQGIPIRSKVKIIFFIWASITISAFLFSQLVWVRVILLTIALAITVYLLRLPTERNGEPEGQ